MGSTGTGSDSQSDCTENEAEFQEGQVKRAPSLSQHERSILYGLVAKYKLIVESKHTTAQWVAKKQATWNTISHEFLAKPGTSSRTPKQLKKCYENFKRIQKQRDILKRQKYLRTPPNTKDGGDGKEHGRRISVRSSIKNLQSGGRHANSERERTQNSKENNNGLEDVHCGNAEGELYSKKVKLVDLQIEYEEMKIRFLQEEHDLRMSLLQKQCAKSNEPFVLNDEVDIKSIIL